MTSRRQAPIGVNVHPYVGATDATSYLSNAAIKMAGLAERTGDEEWLSVRDRLLEVIQAASGKREHLRRSFFTLRMVDFERFKRAREGDEPWPGAEDPEGFTPRCRCFDRCGVHDFERDEEEALAAGWICLCGETCKQHSQPSGCRVRGGDE